MDLSLVYIFCLAAFLGGMVQGLTGFGLNLAAIPILVAFKVPLAQTVLFVTLCSILTSVQMTYQLKSDIEVKPVKEAAIGRILGLIVGLFILSWIEGGDLSQINIAVGSAILFTLLLQKFGKNMFEGKAQNPIVKYLLYFTSGVSGGAVGLSGPPLVLWTLLTDWSADKIKAFLSCSFLILNPINIMLLAYMYPDYFHTSLIPSAIAMVFVYLGTKLGMYLCTKVSQDTVKKTIYITLIIVSIRSLYAGLLN